MDDKKLTETRVTADGVRQFRLVGDIGGWLTVDSDAVRESRAMTAVQKLAELENLMWFRQVLKYPYKIGDMVYAVIDGNILTFFIAGFELTDPNGDSMTVHLENTFGVRLSYCPGLLPSRLAGVFATQEEAEAMLKEYWHSDNEQKGSIA